MTKQAAKRPERRWQMAVGLFVAVGCVATAAYAVVETFWG